MSTHKNDYYGYIKRRIAKYEDLKKEDSIVSYMQALAIGRELEKVKADKKPEKYRAIKMVLFDGHSVNETARNLYYSPDTIVKWISQFVNDVGKNSGF